VSLPAPPLLYKKNSWPPRQRPPFPAGARPRLVGLYGFGMNCPRVSPTPPAGTARPPFLPGRGPLARGFLKAPPSPLLPPNVGSGWGLVAPPPLPFFPCPPLPASFIASPSTPGEPCLSCTGHSRPSVFRTSVKNPHVAPPWGEKGLAAPAAPPQITPPPDLAGTVIQTPPDDWSTRFPPSSPHPTH